MWEAQGQIFHAFEAMKGAKERSAKESAARLAYDAQMKRLGSLIESGAAAEMMKAAGLNPEEQQVAAKEEGGIRRDPGTTTIRRPKKVAEATEEGQEEAAVETAPSDTDATEQAEVDAEEAPVDVASEE